MWKGIDKIRKNLRKFHLYFSPNKGYLSSSEDILENFVHSELKNFNFKKNKREKSLALLSLSLVQLFYEKGPLQTLEETASELSGRLDSKLKTKIRRLYDITNVFKALGLVKKTITPD